MHPLHTQAVTYVIQRSESLMGLFYLLTLYGLVRCGEATTTGGRRFLWAAVAVVCCAAGMATKEVMVTAPLVALLYDRTFLAGSLPAALRRRWGLYVALAGTWLVLAGLIQPDQLVHERGSAGFAMQQISPLGYALTQPGVILRYLQLSLWPVGLCLDYAWPPAAGVGRIAPAAIVIAAALAATAWALWRRTWFGFVAACFFLFLAPTSSIMPIRDLAVEHRMYLSLAAVVVLAVFIVGPMVNRLPTAGRAAALMSVPVVASMLLLATIARNHDYRGEVAVWRSVHRVAADNPRPMANLGAHYLRRSPSKMDLPAFYYGEALRLDPQMVEALTGMAVISQRRGDLDGAAAYLTRALQSAPEYAPARDNLGVVLHQQGRLDLAAEQFRIVLMVWPLRAATHHNLANVLGAQGNLDEAIDHYHEALAINPNLTIARHQLARAFEATGRWHEALGQYRAALGVDEAGVASLCELAWFLATCPDAGLRQPGEAVGLAQRADALTGHRHPHVLDVLAAALAADGKYDQAVATAQRALDAAPKQADDPWTRAVRQRLMLYQRGQPYHRRPTPDRNLSAE